MKRDEEFRTHSRKKKKGVGFSLFFFLLEVKNVAILYTKSIFTHAQILSEANFAKQRRFGVLFTQRRGVLFRTRRRQRSRGALGTRRVLRFSFFLERCVCAIRCDLFRPRERREIPFRCALTLSLSSFFLSLIIIITTNTTSKTVLDGCSGDRFRTLDGFIPRRVGRSRLGERHFRPLRFHPSAERNQRIAVRGDERDGISSGWRDRSRRRFDRHLGTIRGRERTDVNRRRMVRA